MALRTDRQIQVLLADYADALRDGRVDTFLQSLTTRELKTICQSEEFADASDMIQALNQMAFAGQVATPEPDLFIARVDARIASRLEALRPCAQTRPVHQGRMGRGT